MQGKKFGMLTIIKDTGKKFPNRGSIYLCKCDCGKQKEVSWKLLKDEKKPRSCGCSHKIRNKKRFESFFKKTEGCWIWEGSITSNGYGKFRGGAASRAAYQYYIGEIPKGMQVLHMCDNRKCVRPDCLFLGTISDNMKDKTSKNRQSKGSMIGNSVLDEEKTLEIRKLRLNGYKYKELSEKFNICITLIRKVCKNVLWKHVPLGEECKKYVSPHDANQSQHICCS